MRFGTRFQIGYKTISELASRLASFLTVILAARLLERSDFGVFSLAWALGWIVAAVADFGLQLYLARETAFWPERSGALFRRLLCFRLIWSAALAGAAALVSLLLRWPAGGRTAFLLLVVWQLVCALIEFLNYFYRGHSRAHLESTLNLAHRLAALLATSAVLLIYPSLEAVALVLLSTAFVIFLVSLWLALRLSPSAAGTWEGMPWSEVLPIGVGIILSTLYFRLDLFLIEYWEGVTLVASYNAVYRLMEGFRLLPAAVLAVVFPLMCRDRSGKIVVRAGFGLFASALPLAAASAWLGAEMIGLVYGDLYMESLHVFRILLVALPLLFANAALTHQLTAWNLQRQYAWLALGGLLCNAFLNSLLIPSLSIAGAAWATLLTEVYLSCGCILVLVRQRNRSRGRAANGRKP